MNRRAFLKSSTSAAVGGVFALAGVKAVNAAQESVLQDKKAEQSLKRIGLQLYTVRELMRKDFSGTLQKIAEIGYQEVEFAGYFDHKPEAIRKLLETLGVAAPAAHVPIEKLHQEIESVVTTAQAIGHHYIVCPWLAEAERKSVATYKAVAATLNRAGEACRKAGLQLAYHNHDFEFQPVENQIPYDVLLAETDAALVEMELDLFWIRKGGFDALEYFKKHPGRFTLCHIKDMSPAGEMVDVGVGTIDFAAILAHANQAGLKHFFVEHDNPKDPLKSSARSFAFLNKLKF